MFIEKRREGTLIKYFLAYTYRDNRKIKKILRYLGSNLNETELHEKSKIMEIQIKNEILEFSTEVFNFILSKNQINKLDKYNEKIKILHLDKNEWKLFTEKFTYNTNAIEGSEVRLDEVPAILHKTKAENLDEIETKGVANALEFIKETTEDLSLDLIKRIHKLCFEGSKHFAGQFRTIEVVIKDSQGVIVHQGTPVSNLNKELIKFIEWYKKNKNSFKPLVLAAIIHNQFEEIHPFQDGNGRVGRILLNFILMKNKYPPINVLLKDRAEYYQTLQIYHKEGNIRPTLRFLIKQYQKTIKQVTTINKKQRK